MAVRQFGFPNIVPISGIRLASAAAGLYRDRPDVVLIELQSGSQSAAVFTRNAFAAAPVLVAKRHLQQQMPRYLLINAGNANAATGQIGIEHALSCCQALAQACELNPEQVLPFSTGVIGVNLPTEKILRSLPALRRDLAANNWQAAAGAIMTTDTQAKAVYKRIAIGDDSIHLAAFAKGAGMIRPDMATMLAFIFTDVAISSRRLQNCLAAAVAESFHCISIDGDTSTNDAVFLGATAQASALDENNAAHLALFQQALNELCLELALMIVCDGEGATKLIHLQVSEGESASACRQVGFTVAHSPLVKTAFFASDPNWGRILAAVGRAGLTDLDTGKITVYLDELCLFRNGARAAEYSESSAKAIMLQKEISVRIQLGRGEHAANIWTTDLSHDYVSINADYRS